MKIGFKAQLCLWALVLPINLTKSWCINSGMAQTRITSSITEKVVLINTQLEWLVGNADNFWQKYRGGKTSKIKWLFESILRYYSYFKSFRVLDFFVLHPLESNCKGNSFTQNVWSLYSQMKFLTLKIGHWKNRS